MNKQLVAIAAGLFSVSAHALDLEINLALGFSDNPAAEYVYTDNSTQTLDYGDGIGFLIGQEVYQRGPIALDLRAGFHFGFISESEPGLEISDFFNYFPLHATAKYAITDAFSVGGGVSYLFAPKISGSLNDYSYDVTSKNSLGFNLMADYWMAPLSSTSNFALGYTARYTSGVFSGLRATDSDGTDLDIEGQFDDENFGSLTFGINFAF